MHRLIFLHEDKPPKNTKKNPSKILFLLPWETVINPACMIWQNSLMRIVCIFFTDKDHPSMKKSPPFLKRGYCLPTGRGIEWIFEGVLNGLCTLSPGIC